MTGDTYINEGMLLKHMRKEHLDVLTSEEKILLKEAKKGNGITGAELLKKLRK